jgi:transcriptional regulator with XRE-family HTH domain
MDTDWNAVSQQMIRALRGRLSQRAASRRLHFSSNPVSEWEAGRRQPTAVQMFELARVMGADVKGTLAAFHRASAGALGEQEIPDARALARWLTVLRVGTSIKTLAQRSGLSRFTISRMLRGESSFRLSPFLALLHAITIRADDLIGELVPLSAVPALAVNHDRQAILQIGFDEPWSTALLRLMETEPYRRLKAHQPGWLARRLRISAEAESRIVQRLLDAGILSRVGKRLVPHLPESVSLKTGSEKSRRHKMHYARVVEDRIADDLGTEDLAKSTIISVSAPDYEKIKAILVKGHREVRAIARSTPQEEIAALVGLSLIQWGDRDPGNPSGQA